MGVQAGHVISVHHTITVSLSQPGVLQAVVGSGLYLTVLGLFALAIGGLIRHTAGAITAVIGMVLVIFPLAGLLPASWGAHVHAYLPTVAGQLITADKPTSGQLLSPWQGFGVFCAWTVLLLGRRDLRAPAAGRVAAATLTQAGPSNCFRSATRPGDGFTRSLSSSLTTVVRRPLHSRRCTSSSPGWLRSTSWSRSTTTGTHRCTGSDTTKGPLPVADRSGTLTSIAMSFGDSSRRSSLPFTSRIASSVSRVAQPA